MRIFRGLQPVNHHPRALTIGNFDGVHLGHQAMLRHLRQQADTLGCKMAVMVFEPHPREFFTPEAAPARLCNLREKLEQLAQYAVDEVFIARFNQRLAQQEPEDFIQHTLRQQLNTRFLLVGDDFCFGARRRGNISTLKQAQHAGVFEVAAFHSVQAQGERVSSTAVRRALAAGDCPHAAQLLGRAYSMSGRVVQGLQLGRTWGYPTANIHLKHQQPPLQGIFVVTLTDAQGISHQGVASLGWRPTIRHEERPLLEVHLFDFNQNLYGQSVQVHFLHKLRDEAKFADTDALIAQIKLDAAQAQAYFHQQGASKNSKF